MSKIKAPFNFVPLSDNVYTPEWGSLISQDIPFEDGISGTIDLEFKAETPIFIRNAANSRNGIDNHSCRTPDGRFIIPGTTIKGEIRNILNILSCGKIRTGKDVRFAQREWDNTSLYTLKGEQLKLRSGWLVYEDNKYFIKDCGRPYRIGMDEIDSYVGENRLFNNFSVASNNNLNRTILIDGVEYDPKTALYKYKLLEDVNLNDLSFTVLNDSNRRVKVDLNGGEINGSIVLTGQSSLYKYPRPTKLDGSAGKFYEFVFQDKTVSTIPISDEIYRQYSLMYSESADWKYWKKNKKGIPVFFRLDGKKIKDFGLAFLYKLPYEHTVQECAFQEVDNDGFDMADCIFGYTKGEDSMKGRVQFSSAFSENAVESDEVKLVLNNPKASYYPIYINQTVSADSKVSQYRTYNDGQISGYKRYVQRKKIWSKSLDGISEKLISTLIPLKEGAIFKAKVRFHNLKEIELGALLSAITFHKTDACCHQFGQAKPYGFGRTSLKKIELNIARGEQYDMDYYMAVFEKRMNEFMYGQWLASNQMRELIALSANVISEDKSSDFEYMFHENSNSDFNLVKKNREALKRYSRLVTTGVSVNSLWEKYKDAFELKKQQEEIKRKEEEERLKALKEEEERKKSEEIAAQIEKERQQRLEEKMASGLSFLNETANNDANKFKVNDFNGGYKRIEQWMKKTSTSLLGEEYESDLSIWLSRSYNSEKKQKDKDAWKDRNNKNIWKKLEKIIDNEFVDRLFSKTVI